MNTQKPKKKIKAKGTKRFKTRKAAIGLAIIVSIAISAVAYFLIVSPQLARVGVNKEFDVAATANTLKSKQKYLNSLETLKTNAAGIGQADINLISKVLPQDKLVPELMAQLEAMAGQNGVELSAFRVSEEEPQRRTSRQTVEDETAKALQQLRKKGIIILRLNLEITAYNYQNLKSYLEALQTHSRLIDVQQFEFSTDKEKHGITATTYYIEP